MLFFTLLSQFSLVYVPARRCRPSAKASTFRPVCLRLLFCGALLLRGTCRRRCSHRCCSLSCHHNYLTTKQAHSVCRTDRTGKQEQVKNLFEPDNEQQRRTCRVNQVSILKLSKLCSTKCGEIVQTAKEPNKIITRKTFLQQCHSSIKHN